MTTTAERATVDGVPVKVGDVVWRANINGVRPCRLLKHHLGFWWDGFMSKEIYSTERSALLGRIAHERKERDKARREARRTTKSINRLTARLKDVR